MSPRAGRSVHGQSDDACPAASRALAAEGLKPPQALAPESMSFTAGAGR
jgi:hypothetical protein